MIYLTEQEIIKFYGKPDAGTTAGRFNAEAGRRHKDQAYKYEFGYINGHCVYAIIEKATKSKISLEEAQGIRYLSGKGEWKLNTPFDPTKNPKEIQELLDDVQRDLGYTYVPSADDKYKHPLISVLQRQRHQLVIYHPKWIPDLKKVEAKPF